MTTQGQLNENFLSKLDNRTFFVVMDNISNHYGITQEEVLTEVCDEEAENIMDYITGKIRPAIHLLYKNIK